MESAMQLAFFLVFLPLLYFLINNRRSSKMLPPGPLGLPIIGQSLQLLKALRANKGEEWLQERARRYGPISKLSFLGTPTVFLHGQSANKFLYTSDHTTLSNQQPTSFSRILGRKIITEVNAEDHKRLRGAFVSFLKPEALKQYVEKMDEEIRLHLHNHWHHNHEISVMPLMKKLTFDVICTLLLGIERGRRRDRLVYLFKQVMDGTLSFPINLPFTRFNKSLRARSEVGDIIMKLINEKREQLEKKEILDDQDFITSLLSMRDEANSPVLSDEEIIDNSVVAMVAGHDTTAILLTFLIKLLVEHPHVYEAVLKEQEEIARGKGPDELLTWDDLAKMKYTWRVAIETLRIYPPAFSNYRRAVKDIEMGGYIIPKGWQVFVAGCMTHLDESIFPYPDKFNPSRYEKEGAIPPYTFVAFGGGARMCPGYEFARIESLTMIHYLIIGFKWKLSREDNIVSRDPLLDINKGLLIQIENKKTEGA